MANYYVLSEDEKNAYQKARNDVWIDFDWDAIESMTPSQLSAYDKKVKDVCGAALNGAIVVEGSKKAEIIAEACRRLEAKGRDEAHIMRLSYYKDAHAYEVAQSWFVFKDGGEWFFKMNRKCKARHEVAL